MELNRKKFAGSSFVRIFIPLCLMIALIDFALYYGAIYELTRFSTLAAAAEGTTKMAEMAAVVERFSFIFDNFFKWVLPVSLGVLVVFTALIWMLVKGAYSKVAVLPVEEKQKDRKPAEDKKKREITDRRLFLHLLSVLQREGRLMDFFSEDLSLYEDDQVGAAVRNIHENCLKVMAKYISPESVIDKNEGDEVVIEKGFDPAQVKLTGNVSGEPPFKGVLRHKGWKASKLEIPTLSASENPMIIAPAEVEIE